MGKINNVFSTPLQAVNNVNRVDGKAEEIKLEFDPKDIGATRQKNGQFPPTKTVTENAVETALLKHFGFDVKDSADIARVKQLLQTDDNPFAALQTSSDSESGELVADYNNRTGKYEIFDNVEKNLYRQLQGKAAEVKTQIEKEKQNVISNQANPNEVIAGRNGITNNKRTELENKLNNQPSISAPNRNESEKTVKGITNAIESVTGTSNPFAGTEIGKQFNRLGVSSLRLSGKALELSNYFNEKLNDAIRYVAPDSVDELLNQTDKMNRENAEALQNASSAVTNEDKYIDTKTRQLGQEIPVTEDLANKLMYFPEAIPNAIDSAIKGDFKEDDGSYSDKFGKFIGGLNPMGDVRDIIANGKKVIGGDGKATIPLIASIIGGVPGAGDIAKPIIKEVGEELTKKAIKETGGETVEKVVKEEVPQTIKQTGKLKIEAGRTLSSDEQEIANLLTADGKNVKAPKEVNIPGVKNPDFEVEGVKTELKTIENITSADIGGAVSRRIYEAGRQAPNVIIDVRKQAGMTKEIAENAAERAFLLQKRTGNERLKEVRLLGVEFDFTVKK